MFFRHLGVRPPDLYDNDAGNLAAVVPVPSNESIPRGYRDLPSIAGRKTGVSLRPLHNRARSEHITLLLQYSTSLCLRSENSSGWRSNSLLPVLA